MAQPGDYPRRIGWEFVERPPLRPFPLEGRPPQLSHIPRPPISQLSAATKQDRVAAFALLVLGVVVLLLGLSGDGGERIVFTGIAAALFYWSLKEAMSGRRQEEAAERNYASDIASRDQQHASALAEWKAKRTEWQAKEEARVLATPMYYQVNVADPERRLDVFGGRPVSWASFLNTLARPLIDASVGVAVLDLTEASLAVELAIYAAHRGRNVRQCVLPTDLEHVDLLKGFDATVAAEVLASTFHAVKDRSGREDAEQCEIDTAIITAICTILVSGGLTVERILAGLDIASQAPVVHNEVTPDEIRALQTNPYLSVVPEIVRNRYAYLRPRLGRLALMGTTDRESAAQLPDAGELSILAVSARHVTEAKMFASLLSQCMLQRLGGAKREGTEFPLLFIAGADLLSLETMRRLSRKADQANVRLVFLFSAIEEDAERMLGSDGAHAVFFSLESAPQAEIAANFIGKGHRFVLGQVSKSVGDSLGGSRGESRSFTSSSSDTTTMGATYGRGAAPGSDSWSYSSTNGYAKMQGTQWSDTWQKTDTYGETYMRVYEYSTEPTILQNLAVTSFVFVERAGGQSRVVGGDANPLLELASYAAPYSREQCPLRSEVEAPHAGGNYYRFYDG